MASQRLLRLILTLTLCAASVAGISSPASAALDDVFGLDLTITAEGSPVGVFDAQYLTLQGDGSLNLALFGHDFTQGSSQEITLHKGSCASPGSLVDRFEVDPLLRLLPIDPNPRATSILNTLFEGTPGALRYETGSVGTAIPLGDVTTFEAEYVIVINEIGSGAGDYFCATPTDRLALGASAGAGTVYPLYFKELNGSGVTATGSATLLGNILQLDLSYEGLTQLVGAHFQLLRQGALCPTGDIATELEIGGTIELALTEGARSLLPIDVLTGNSFGVHPVAGLGGTIDYVAQIALTDDQVAVFASSAILIHGFDANGNGLVDGGISPIAPGLTGDETAVAGCGQFVPMAPDAPSNVAASVAGADITVTWEAPADDGGSAITGYTVTLSDGSEETVNGTTLSATFTGVDDGNYTATVIATSAGGDSPSSTPSAEVTVDTTTEPDPPTNVAATVDEADITITWDAPADDGGKPITGYTVTLSDGSEETVNGTTLTATFTGIDDGDYTATVTATNTNGNSPTSTPSAQITVDTTTAPDPPTNVAATVDGADITVTWEAPGDDGGKPITGYTVSISNGTELTVDGTTLTAEFVWSPNGTYTATVVATNANGDSPASVASAAVVIDTTTVPMSPSAVVAALTDDDITITWEAPADDGGREVTDYTVTLSDGSTQAVDGTTLTAVFNDVEDGDYSATVVATNSLGDSPASEPSNEVSLDTSTAPGSPTEVSAVFSRPDLVVSWAAPIDDGGKPITGYTVTLSDGSQMTVDGDARQAVFSEPDNGTYTATVIAVNENGPSTSSAPSQPVVVADVETPGEPEDLAVRAVGTRVIVTWNPPANAAEAEVEGYDVELTNGSTMTVTGTVAEFVDQETGPVNATVLAFNAFGSSAATASPVTVTVRDCQDGDVDDDWDDRVASAEQGSVFRLYCGYFLRYPDDEGYEYWQGIYDDGASLAAISNQFAASAEFSNTYGSLNNDEFVRLLYRNVLLRPVEPEGYEYWKGFLDRNELTQGETMMWVTQSQEFQNVTGTP